MEMKQGDERFTYNNECLPRSVLNFWQWAASDLLNNTLRGRLAEYIVATALEIDQNPRIEWAPYDLDYHGLKIEVKSSAYVQSWYQAKASNISFGIRPTLAWDIATNLLDTHKKHQADIYIFCLLQEKDKAKVDPLNLDQWRFFLISTSRLEFHCGGAKTIGLSRLEKLQPVITDFKGMKSAINRIEISAKPL